MLANGVLASSKILSRIAIFTALSSFSYSGHIMSVRQAFVVTAYFHYIHSSMFTNWAAAWSALAQFRIAIKRMEHFLLMPDIAREMLPTEDPTMKVIKAAEKHSVRMQNVSASWATACNKSERKPIVLQNINLSVHEPDLLVIVGAVGSGKSTVLQVLLGELAADSGTVELNGTVSYAGQEAWLFDGTIRQNIVFVDAFDAKRYEEVIDACALRSDLDGFPAGDATAVGERGIGLSGGQRARISLARSVYKKADVYLLDDPLAAVDTAVGQHIFAECIQRFLMVCSIITCVFCFQVL